MKIKSIFKLFISLQFIFLLISCNEKIETSIIIKKCANPTKCELNEDCKFISINDTLGECVKKLECNESYECDNNRDCISYDNIKTCGRNGEFKVSDDDLPPMYLYENYNYKIEVINQQGEYYFILTEGKLPQGITLNSKGVLIGQPNDEPNIYNFTIEVINAPLNSNIFFNYIKIIKKFELNLKDNDPCNYRCNKYQNCDIDTGLCGDTEIPEDMIRIYMNDNNKVYQGYLIAEWNHNIWWWDDGDEYTYAVFTEDEFNNNGDSDKSINILSSDNIDYIEASSTYLNINEYDDFLIKEDIVLSLPFKNESFVVQGNEGYHKEEDGYGDFAYDFVKSNENDETYINDGNENSDYLVWNESVYLPVDGEVFEIHDNNNDNEIPGEYIDESESNMIGIKIKGNYYLYLLHFKRDSIPMLENHNCEENIDNSEDFNQIECISVGKKLKAGTYIGKVGNSGVSLVPHLHLTMFWFDIRSDDNVRMWSIPSIFKNIKILNGEDYDFYRPKTGDKLKEI